MAEQGKTDLPEDEQGQAFKILLDNLVKCLINISELSNSDYRLLKKLKTLILITVITSSIATISGVLLLLLQLLQLLLM